MNYDKNHLLKDYTYRTRMNLEYIEKVIQENPEAELFEVTQLINSMLGLLVFPFEKMRFMIPETNLSQLKEQGWSVPKITGKFPEVITLRQLIRYLRNAVAHFNMDFIPNDDGLIEGVKVWNTFEGRITWRAEMNIHELRDIVYRFTDLILNLNDGNQPQ